jgi:Flp pilus assembly protein TadG
MNPQASLKRRSMPHRLLHRLRARGESGQAAVELALCLPVLLLVVTGITTFGIAMNNYIELTEATGTGARQFAIARGMAGDQCALAAAAIAAAAPTLANTGSVTGIGYSFTVGGQTYKAASPSCPNASLVQGQTVVVSTTYPCVLKVFQANYAPSCSLSAKTTEVLQ